MANWRYREKGSRKYTKQQLVEGLYTVAAGCKLRWVTEKQYDKARRGLALPSSYVITGRLGWSKANVLMLRTFFRTNMKLERVQGYVRVDR